MKKVLALILVLVMVLALGLTGCEKTDVADTADSDADTSAPADDATDDSTTDDATDDTAAAGDEDFDPADYPLAIAMGVMNHPVHRIVQLGFLKAAQDLGYTAEVIGTEGGDQNEVYAAIDAAVATGTKGIMVWAGDDTCFPTLLKMDAAGVAAGIAHFKFDPAPEGLTFNLACDPVAYGKEAAEMIAEAIEGKTGTIAVTQNTKNITENAAAESFIATLEAMNLEGVTVLEPELEGADIAEATNINAAIIQKNPDLIAAFGTTGNSPVTWADAAAKAGKAPGEIAIIGMDYTEANLAKLESGEVLAIVAQPLYDEAKKTVELFDQYFRTGEVPAWTDLEAPLVYVGGEGVNSPEYYKAILEEVKTWFE
jgi:ribose transport system substrate-binding protein